MRTWIHPLTRKHSSYRTRRDVSKHGFGAAARRSSRWRNAGCCPFRLSGSELLTGHLW